ncbi:MAG: adenylate/guanylate cyclase domain-containing protein, partial [Actinomycetota bacterium]
MAAVPGETAGERRVVTALFADVVGSTTLMESIDPEDWTNVVNGAFEEMTAAVDRYGGTVAQLQGDALVAFFGAPVAHEDDPVRAIHTALQMIDRVGAYNKGLQEVDFQIRVGVNTGPVLVGKVGAGDHQQYTAMGDAMNTAARLETAASPGMVLIGETTFRQVAAFFETKEVGPMELKGKARPVRAYEVIAAKQGPVRARGVAGLRSPLVGRDDELSRLREMFDVIGPGRGAVACLIGDAGLGKSRLLAEFRSWAEGDRGDLRWVEGKAVSYGGNLAYHLTLDLVRSCLDISPATSAGETEAALRRQLSVLADEDRRVAYPLIAHLLSLPLDPADADFIGKMDPEVLLGRYASGLKQLLNAMTQGGPCVIVLEDVHWADHVSVELLGRLIALGAPLHTLVCITTRPEAGAPGQRFIELAREIFTETLTEIKLGPLPETQAGNLFSSLLEVESLPTLVRNSILGRAQ